MARLQAIKDSSDWFDFRCNDEPKCPHCGESHPISENEWWQLYEGGEHDVTCPSCDEDFTVSTNISYTFSTDTQEEEPQP